jgi:hypothetical protein
VGVIVVVVGIHLAVAAIIGAVLCDSGMVVDLFFFHSDGDGRRDGGLGLVLFPVVTARRHGGRCGRRFRGDGLGPVAEEALDLLHLFFYFLATSA